jgi:hypothetical protein
MKQNLSKIEKITYEFIRDIGEIQTKNFPDRNMMGAIASLKTKGLVKIYKKYSSRFKHKKKKYVTITESNKKIV